MIVPAPSQPMLQRIQVLLRSHLACWTGWIYRLTRWVLGTVFIISGIAKLMDPQHFALIIKAYGLIPNGVILPAAVVLALLEVAAGAGLVFDLRWSLGTITGLLVLFMLILGYGLHMGLDVDCGCFGPGDPEGEAYHSLRPALYRDALMLLSAAFLFYWRRQAALSPVSLKQRCQEWMQRRARQ